MQLKNSLAREVLLVKSYLYETLSKNKILIKVISYEDVVYIYKGLLLLGKVCGSAAKASEVATSTFEFFSNNSYLNKNSI